MKVHFIRSGERRYSMRIEREGAPALVMDPAPGFDPDLPHDMVHFVVEAALGLKAGVFGQIAAGGDAGSFHVEAGGALSAKERQRAARKQVGIETGGRIHDEHRQTLALDPHAVAALARTDEMDFHGPAL